MEIGEDVYFSVRLVSCPPPGNLLYENVKSTKIIRDCISEDNVETIVVWMTFVMNKVPDSQVFRSKLQFSLQKKVPTAPEEESYSVDRDSGSVEAAGTPAVEME